MLVDPFPLAPRAALRPGISSWTDTAAPFAGGAAGSVEERFDAAVIGGGSGAAAWEMARAGLKVAVLEKGVISGEQSRRTWGWRRQQNRDEGELPLSIAPLRMWDALRQETGEDLGFRRAGLIYGANDLDRWEAWGRMAAGYGVERRVLTAALLPGDARTWRGGVHSPTDGQAEPVIAVRSSPRPPAAKPCIRPTAKTQAGS